MNVMSVAASMRAAPSSTSRAPIQRISTAIDGPDDLRERLRQRGDARDADHALASNDGSRRAKRRSSYASPPNDFTSRMPLTDFLQHAA